MKKLMVVTIAVCLIGGCGGGDDRVDVVPVKGKLFLDDQPHGPATLVLYPVPASAKVDPRPAVGGDVQADGSFTLTTYDTGDGAPPGQYTAQLQGATASGSVDPAQMMAAMSGTAVQETTVDIPAAGTDNLEIRLKSAPKSGNQNSGGTLLGQ